MSCKRYCVAECDFGLSGCVGSALSDSRQTTSEVYRTLEILGWRWEGKLLACSPCARERQTAAGIEVSR